MAEEGDSDAGHRPAGTRQPDSARERIIEASYRLFSHHGIHAVGIDRIVAEADVAKATLYHHFASKEALVVAFLERREERWTYGWLAAEAERRATTAEGRVLAVFDVLDEWFRRPDFEGCSFINTLLEFPDRESPVHRAAIRHLAVVQGLLQSYCEQAGASEPEEAAHALEILLMGSIVSAARADLDAARTARGLVAAVLGGAGGG
jgi:AcrR family transcriptional regulator